MNYIVYQCLFIERNSWNMVWSINMSNIYNISISFWANWTDICNRSKPWIRFKKPGLSSLIQGLGLGFRANCLCNKCISPCTLVWYVSNILPLWMVCATFDESFWVVSRIYNTTRNIHMIARFTIQLMGNNSKKQSPARPTSNILKPYWANRDCNYICLDYFPE